MARKIRNWQDWTDYFQAWTREIGMVGEHVGEYTFQPLFGETASHVEFGDFMGERKWETVLQIPDQRIRDACEYLIAVQGDTEFASVEQQRHLYDTAPSDYDFKALARVNREEMRHGFQMSYLLVHYFGDSGRREAQKLLERRAFKKNRLLGSFNEDVENWIDFFTFTQFIDRDGKYQLKMLSRSAFSPLARSMGPMLKEESFHLGTGNDGIKRIIRAGKVPIWLLQKYFNKWISTAYDLFGVDHSSSAQWGYVYGLKGRYDEDSNPAPVDRENLNEHARSLFYKEIHDLVETANRLIPEGQPRLYVPDTKFNRMIGGHKGERWSVDGRLLTPGEYESHLRAVLPRPDDIALASSFMRETGWIAPKNAGDPD
ncbi:MAG: Phenylacetic acid catabolic protein [Candidatus Methylomirabilia bacterium]